MNITETKLSNTCKKMNWYCQKLNTHTYTGNGTDQVSDYLVANDKGVYAVECKGRSGDRFDLKDLTQSLKMKILLKKSNKFIPYILLNYYEHNKLFLFSFEDMLILKEHNKFENGKVKKSFNHKFIPDHYRIEWNELGDKL